MNHLPHLIKALLYADLRSLNPGLTQIDCVSQQRTARVDSLGVTALLQLYSLGFQKLADVLVKLIFLYWIHNV